MAISTLSVRKNKLTMKEVQIAERKRAAKERADAMNERLKGFEREAVIARAGVNKKRK